MERRFKMKKSQILATSWMTGFPLAVIFIVSQIAFSSSQALLNLTREETIALPPTCSDQKVNEVLAPARELGPKTVSIDCNLNLSSSDVVWKRMIFSGSDATGLTVNCNGATLHGGKDTQNYNKDMIEVKSKKIGTRWERPENITIKNCNIIGSVRVWGMGKNGEAYDVKESSRREKKKSRAYLHVTRVRNNAPKNIVFDNVTITGVGRNPLYFAPGVTYSKLINSEMKGKSDRVAIYLDAESAYNTIKNNYIHVVTKKDQWGRVPGVVNRGWPLIAIDGSTRNKILNNKFSSLNHGGIYLYRNCGEGGTIRHTTPSRNLIINNIFYYKNYKGGKPAVYLGSRDYGFKERHPGHCDKDDGRPYGSSASEKDYARHNVVMQNQFYKRRIYRPRLGYPPGNVLVDASIGDMIKTKNPAVNSPNYIDHNQMVTAERKRPAGCYVVNGYKNFILHGQSIDVFKNSKGEPTCTGPKYTCNNGDLIRSAAPNCRVTKVSFDCQVSGNNNGCKKNISCPSGRKIVGARAACNLEYGTISGSQLAAVPANKIKVIRTSDRVSDGRCYVGGNSLKSGQKTISGIIGRRSVSVGCKEHDKNGGDCHIKGILYCR
jgi:parallel beta-helix repeat protein